MKKILGLISSLTLIAAICAAVLAYVSKVTEAPIANMKIEQEQAAIRAVMPNGVTKIEAVEHDQITYYKGVNDAGEVVGYAANGKDSGGYGGDIELMVGFLDDRQTIVHYKTLVASETPGLGMKLNTPEFANQFNGKSATKLKLKKKGGDIEAITSATVTSKAVIKAIKDAAKKLQ